MHTIYTISFANKSITLLQAELVYFLLILTLDNLIKSYTKANNDIKCRNLTMPLYLIYDYLAKINLTFTAGK